MRYNEQSNSSFTTQGQVWVSNRRVCGYTPRFGRLSALRELSTQYDSTRPLVLAAFGLKRAFDSVLMFGFRPYSKGFRPSSRLLIFLRFFIQSQFYSGARFLWARPELIKSSGTNKDNQLWCLPPRDMRSRFALPAPTYTKSNLLTLPGLHYYS